MTMAIDPNHQRFPLNYDHMSSYPAGGQPHFTNPWVSTSSAAAPPSQTASHTMYMSSQPGLNHSPLSMNMKHHQQPQPQQPLPPPVSRMSTSSAPSMASYGSIPTSSAGSTLSMTDNAYAGQQNLLPLPQDLLSLSRLPPQTTSAGAYADSAYTTTAASPIHPTYAPSPTPYDQLGYAAAPMRSTFALPAEQDARRYSQSSVSSALDAQLAGSVAHRNSVVDMRNRRSFPADDRKSFADAIEASHGILSLNQETPRAVYANQRNGSGDSYGFPQTHSNSSSVSSTGFGGYYGGGSIDSSVSDYSTAGSDIESVASRTLPRPHNLMATQVPPAPQSMMGQFSSKVSSGTQKKHKCKVCDKRFTRPSSLQTHMYSHTGEKREPAPSCLGKPPLTICDSVLMQGRRLWPALLGGVQPEAPPQGTQGPDAQRGRFRGPTVGLGPQRGTSKLVPPRDSNSQPRTFTI